MSPEERQRDRLEFECLCIEGASRRALDFTVNDRERAHLLSIATATAWLLENIAAAKAGEPRPA